MVLVISDAPLSIPDYKISTHQHTMADLIAEHEDDAYVLVRYVDYGLMGNISAAIKHVHYDHHLTVLLGNERCDMMLDYKHTDSGVVYARTYNVKHLYVVAVNRQLAAWIIDKLHPISDDELFKLLERSVRTGQAYHHDADEVLDVTAVTVYPSPLSLDPRHIHDRDTLYRLSQCVKPDDLIPAEVDRVYYFFGVIAALVLALLVIFMYIAIRRIVPTRN